MQPIMTIDPGANGGICLATETDIRCYKIPASLVDKAALLTALRMQFPEKLEAIMEDVGFHREGSHAQGSAKLARHVGQLEMGLMMLDIPVRYIRSQKWMTVFPDRPKNLNKQEKEDLKMKYPSYSAKQFKKVIDKANAERKKARKAYIKVKVQEVFPSVKVYAKPDGKPKNTITDYVSDALGILVWVRNQQ